MRKLRLTVGSVYRAPSPPRTLGADGKRYWKHVAEHVQLSPEQLDLLEACCKFLDRAQQAAAQVKRDGAYLTSKQDTCYPHPGIAVERASLQSFERCRRALNIDAVPAIKQQPLRAAYK